MNSYICLRGILYCDTLKKNTLHSRNYPFNIFIVLLHVHALTAQISQIVTALHWITLLLFIARTFFAASMSKKSICTIIFTVFIPWPNASCNINWNKMHSYINMYKYVLATSSIGSVNLPVIETMEDSQQSDNHIGWKTFKVKFFMEM